MRLARLQELPLQSCSLACHPAVEPGRIGNDDAIEEWACVKLDGALVADGDTYTGIIPTTALSANSPAELRCAVNYVISPHLLGQSDDTRTLGLMLDDIQIQPRKPAS